MASCLCDLFFSQLFVANFAYDVSKRVAIQMYSDHKIYLFQSTHFANSKVIPAIIIYFYQNLESVHTELLATAYTLADIDKLWYPTHF